MSDSTLVTFLPVSELQARLILGAMKAVAAPQGELRPADRDALVGAARHVLYAGGQLELAILDAPQGDALARALPTPSCAVTPCS